MECLANYSEAHETAPQYSEYGVEMPKDYNPRPAHGKCQCCNVVADKLYCDYDQQQRFRGYICRQCKLMLAYANDVPVILQRAADVLSATTRTAAG
jgi:hypothetical protein